MAIRLFEEAAHASIYRQFRPDYPKKLLELISNYVKQCTDRFDVAVDVGCGSGQSTFYLHGTFKHCIGVDISKSQIREATEACKENGAQNVTFLEGSAENIPVEPGSVDVVTIAQAWHWLDPDVFYGECKRVLKPGGCLAVYGYGQGHMLNEKCDLILQDFYGNTLKGCWSERRRIVDDNYKDVVLPFRNTKRHDFGMTKSFTLDSYFGYVSTWSGYRKYCKTNPGNTVLQELKEKIKGVLLKGKDSTVAETLNNVEVCFPVFLNLGQK